MDAIETSIWASMAGALLVVMVPAVVHWLRTGSRAARRGLVFLLSTSAWALLLSDLPVQLWAPGLSHRLLPAKAGLAPVAGGLAMSYLGLWLGIVREDKLIRRAVSLGSKCAVLAGLGLALWAMGAEAGPESIGILALSGLVTYGAVLLAVLAAVRAAVLGDPQARSMAFACLCLAIMVAGLYAKALEVPGFGSPAWALTAVCVVVFCMVSTQLNVRRNRERRKLHQLARGIHVPDTVTGLPAGMDLLAQVDDVLWRSDRVRREAVVVALWVSNLYERSVDMDPQIDARIRISLTARLRRAAGFRNVVGLYHPRCFVVAVSAVQDPRTIKKLIERMRNQLLRPMQIGGQTDTQQQFVPQLGIGIVRVHGCTSEPRLVVEDAERLALTALGTAGQAAIHCMGDEAVYPLPAYDFPPRAHRPETRPAPAQPD